MNEHAPASLPGVYGWLEPAAARDAGQAAGPDSAQRLAALGHGDPAGARITAGAAAGAAAAGGTWQDPASGLLLAWAGQPRLADGPHAGDRARLAEAVVSAYRREPASTPARLQGAFALAVLDPGAQRAVLAVDRLGIWDLAWAVRNETLVFAQGADRVAADAAIAADLDAQALYDYLFHHVVPRPHTVFRDVRRLRPGQALVFEAGSARTFAYWQPTFNEQDRTPIPELEAEFRSTLRDAVGRAAATGNVGAFLSGGTDSSTLTGMLGEVTGAAPRTYSIGFDAPGYDETAFARIAADRFGADHHEYYVTPSDVASAIPKVAAAYDQPFGNASVIPAYYCAALAADDGVNVLLGGDGGDELFAGNARYAKEWLFTLYQGVPAWMRAGVVEPLLAVPGARSLPPLRKVARYVEQARLSVPERMVSWNLLMFVGAERVFTAEFLAQVDAAAPQADIAREYQRFTDYAPLNRLLGVDLKFTLGDDDLRKVMGATAMAGVESRFPFLDEAVVDLAALVPPASKLRRTHLRHFFKHALRDYLPREILEKEKHGFGLPFGEWLRTDPTLRELARDSLDGLRGRGIVRPEMIDELTGTRIEQHAGYFGTLTWVLMMLEQWFRHHPDARWKGQ